MKRQRGVALLVALLSLALAVMVVAALLREGELRQARLRDHWRAEQAWQLHGGLEAWARRSLAVSAAGIGASDTSVEYGGSRLQGRLRDLGGCFNVNALAPQGRTDPVALARLERLLALLQLPATLAAQAADYVDADDVALPGGAEQAAHAAARPPGRPANRALADPGELQQLPAMATGYWRQLAPWLCALPDDHRINLNVAPPELWRLLDPRLDGGTAARLAQPGTGLAPRYADLAAVRAALEAEGIDGASLEGFSVDSRYFMLEADIVADEIPFAFHSLLQRSPDGVRVLARARAAH
jgi:general secretion pathway protein K